MEILNTESRGKFMAGTYKSALRLAVLSVLMSVAYTVKADTVTTGTVIDIGPTNFTGSGTSVPFFIYLSTNDTNIGCNSTALNAFAIDETTDAGRAMIAVVITARLTGQPITVHGTGACSLWSLTDTVSSINL
jgi:hypothetical protein